MIDNNYKILINNKIIDIINYKEILDYKSTCIVIKAQYIVIKVYGKDLMINKLDEKELSIIGKYNNIEFINE